MEKHFVASGLIFDNEKILLIKHKKIGSWIYPGGHCELNENPEDCLKREVKEETGYSIKVVESSIFKYFDDQVRSISVPFCVLEEQIVENDKTHIHIDFVYLCELDKSIKQIENNENSEYQWFSFNQATNLNMIKNFKELLICAFNVRTNECKKV